MARNALIQVRRDTAANWTSVNPTLDSGEFGFETDTGRLKIGNGSTAWTSLRYSSDAYGTTTIRAAATQDGVALAGRAGGTSSYEVTITPTTLGADRTFTLPNVSGTAITTGNLTDITTTGTVTSGTWSGSFGSVSGANLTTLNASNLSSGTVASARVSGSYTGITGLGTLSSLIVNGSNTDSPQIEIGDWNQDGRYSAVRSAYGYLLLGSAVNVNCYLRTDNVNGTVIIGGGANNNVMTVGATDVAITGSLALSASTNAYVSYANTPDTAMPWMQGPTFQGQTGWAFYSASLGSYRMGFRGTSNGATRYMWCADWAYFGSAPNDSRVTSGVTVEGDVRSYSSYIATNYFISTASPTGSGNAAQWLAAFGQYYLVRNTSTREEKENFQSVGKWLTPDMLDRINVQMWNRTNAPNVPEIGPLAEDMEAISPFLGVRGMDLDENGEVVVTPVQGINQNSWLSLLTVALQDAREQIKNLTDRLAVLESN